MVRDDEEGKGEEKDIQKDVEDEKKAAKQGESEEQEKIEIRNGKWTTS